MDLLLKLLKEQKHGIGKEDYIEKMDLPLNGLEELVLGRVAKNGI